MLFKQAQMKTSYEKTDIHEKKQVRSCEGFELFAHLNQYKLNSIQKTPLQKYSFPVSTETNNNHHSKSTIVPIDFISLTKMTTIFNNLGVNSIVFFNSTVQALGYAS